MLDADLKVFVAGLCVFPDLCCLLLSLANGVFLKHNGFCEILEELVQFDKRLLNLLDIIVSCADRS